MRSSPLQLAGWVSYIRPKAEYVEAEPLLKRALVVSEKALGPGDPDVAIRLNNLAELYRAQGRYDEAEPAYKRALRILSERAYGPDHASIGTPT